MNINRQKINRLNCTRAIFAEPGLSAEKSLRFDFAQRPDSGFVRSLRFDCAQRPDSGIARSLRFDFAQRPDSGFVRSLRFDCAQRPDLGFVRRVVSGLIMLAVILLVPLGSQPAMAAEWDRMTIPRVKYDGGGDWYVGPTSMPNLLKQAGVRLQLPVHPENVAVSISDPELFRYPMLFLTGHGQVRFKDHEINTLLVYLNNGGFLWANDSYGIDKFIRREIKRLYPDRELELLPANHPIFNSAYELKDGLPKIHEHDGKPPAAWALFDKGRMKILYTYESDIGDGLEDEGVHNLDTPAIREKAMQMAMNILVYVMMQ